jgi:hypothetical protein
MREGVGGSAALIYIADCTIRTVKPVNGATRVLSDVPTGRRCAFGIGGPDSCTATSWDIWSTGAASSDTRGTSQPAWNYKEATSIATKGGSGCTDGWVTVDGKNFFQRAATANQSRGYMGIRATSETDGNSFKQFRCRNAADSTRVPYAVVNYNSYPTVGVRSTNPSSACVTGSGRPYINSTTPTLSASISDGAGSAVKGIFEWYAAGGAKIGGATSGTAASGSTISTTVPASTFANNSSYSWRVAGNDGTVGGAWSSPGGRGPGRD